MILMGLRVRLIFLYKGRVSEPQSRMKRLSCGSGASSCMRWFNSATVDLRETAELMRTLVSGLCYMSLSDPS